ncbi:MULTISPECIES: DUF1236 domain-containing protein [unclassified Bosea (in: a-proteobacteria)]|uniref:DUF1236 domain-containing protein n=1 Tax=unclassified Bosea (in: a-proteobacteria) TaxID=2653178 RepID=UPI000F750C35|nr:MULTISPECIES: DUF1236 domain-containing protein [unclassified Bosea (in: a-proteobacteria)]AZO81861.1 hypothetical protein BLM15_29015 [Bosea sp. Tri-49]RXT16778.1 hypothetical protein B5U98_26820 [Bosea sp. Tri-39]RXT37524.1 hypothetical protein B5U99_12595 [Bosea sp. Tri-54]
MNRSLLGLVAASALVASSAVVAQTTVMIGQPEQTRIKEYVVKEKMKPVTIKENVTVGATLPSDVELHTAPNDWGPSVTKYRYVYTDNHVVLVEPSTRRVVQIIQ